MRLAGYEKVLAGALRSRFIVCGVKTYRTVGLRPYLQFDPGIMLVVEVAVYPITVPPVLQVPLLTSEADGARCECADAFSSRGLLARSPQRMILPERCLGDVVSICWERLLNERLGVPVMAIVR